MRSLGLIPVLFALNTVMQATAAPAPAQVTKVVPLPVLGGLTLGMVLPTNVPSPSTPNAGLPGGGGGLPKLLGPLRKRAVHGNPRLQPREFHNADFSASPNATVPMPPPQPTMAAKVERRGRPSQKDQPIDAGASGSGNPAQGATGVIKGIGAIPKQVSPAYYSLPLDQVPDTPVTQPDALPADEQLPAPAPAPAPVPQEEAPAPEDPNAYPSGPGYPVAPGYQSAGSSDFVADDAAAQGDASAPAPEKRHDLILDTDPLIPPSDGAPRDPRMGLLNLDSNKKPDPVDAVPQVPKPDVPVDSDTAPPAEDSSYPGSYPTTPEGPVAQEPPATAA